MHALPQLSDHLDNHVYLRSKPRPCQKSSGDPVNLPRFRAIESAKLIEHQMFFWGRDVMHPEGNLLLAAGCQGLARKDNSHAVRCYRLECAMATITFHSTGVSLQRKDGSRGVVYLRPRHRLFHLASDAVPLPYEASELQTLHRVRPNEFPRALSTLLAFVRAYERWVSHRWSPGSRLAAWREQKATASKGIRWLKPEDSMRWLDACLAAREVAAPGSWASSETFDFPAMESSHRTVGL